MWQQRSCAFLQMRGFGCAFFVMGGLEDHKKIGNKTKLNQKGVLENGRKNHH
ncbi:MAG: hypothetical protein IKN72_07050 [Clostridia bacterium]|nr:hypothetical protein [Clostridia bacterium]